MKLTSFMPVKLVTGAGCVRSGAKEMAKLGKRCLIVTGKTSAKVCGALRLYRHRRRVLSYTRNATVTPPLLRGQKGA